MKCAGRDRSLYLAAVVCVCGLGSIPAPAQLLGTEFQVNSYTTGDQMYPRVAANAAGNFVVTWNSNLQDGSFGGTFGRRMTVALFAGDFEGADVCAWSFAVGSGDVC